MSDYLFNLSKSPWTFCIPKRNVSLSYPPPSLVPRPRPLMRKKGSGDIWPISWVSLSWLLFCEKFCSCKSRCRKHNLWLHHRKFVSSAFQGARLLSLPKIFKGTWTASKAKHSCSLIQFFFINHPANLVGLRGCWLWILIWAMNTDLSHEYCFTNLLSLQEHMRSCCYRQLQVGCPVQIRCWSF